MYAPIHVPSRDDVAAGPDLHAENCCVKTCRVPSARSGGRVPQDQRHDVACVVLRVDLLNPRSKPTRSERHALPRPAARHAHGVKWRGGGAGGSRVEPPAVETSLERARDLSWSVCAVITL